MSKYKIILSGGTVPWMNLKQTLKLVGEVGYDGLEILPTRRVISDFKNLVELNPLAVQSVHQSWRRALPYGSQRKSMGPHSGSYCELPVSRRKENPAGYGSEDKDYYRAQQASSHEWIRALDGKPHSLHARLHVPRQMARAAPCGI